MPKLNKTAPHILIIALTLTIVTHNLQATGINNFGQNKLLSSLSNENFDNESLTEESGSVPSQPVSYQKKNAIIATPQLETPSLVTLNLTATTPDGSALVKPLIGTDILAPKNRLRDQTEEYIVKDGDTIASISETYSVTVNTILWENRLTTKSVLRVGQKLSILPTSGVSHTVRSGDNISKIAKLYDVEPDEIFAFNELQNSAQIRIGEKLIIPEGQIIVRPTPPVQLATPPKTRVASLKEIFTTPIKNPLTPAKLLWPTISHFVNQYFTWRHTGLDIRGDFTSDIYVSEDGTVETSGWNSGGYGIQVLVDHGNGLKTRYAHLSKMLVTAGQSVKRGETIGIMGSTGHSTGTHLHYEVMVNGVKKNPLYYTK